MNFDQQYTHARAQMEGGDWKLRAEIADLEARVKELEGALEEATAALDFLNSAGHGTKATIRAMLRARVLLRMKG